MAAPPSPVSPPRFRLTFCSGPECGDLRGSAALHEQCVRLLRERALEGQVVVAWQCCFGQCSQGPNLFVRAATPTAAATAPSPADVLALPAPGTTLYGGLTPPDIERIVDEHLGEGRIVTTLVVRRR